MKQILIAIFLLVAATGRGQSSDSSAVVLTHIYGDSMTFTLGKVTISPCPMDTLKGILIWHDGSNVNNGDSWTYGYWIGKCGPVGEMPLEDLIFIPGVSRMTRLVMNQGEKHWHKEEVEYVNKGFRDARFRPISGRRVYAFIIIRKP